MEYISKYKTWVKLLAGTTLLLSGLTASAADVESILETELLAKAKPDECYNGIGNEYKPLIEGECTGENEQPKVNAAYVWGLTQTDDYIWFGTMANTHCAVFGTYLGELGASANDSWVCEGAQSRYPEYMADLTGNSTFNMLGSLGLGDWRVPKMYRYNKNTGETEDITPADNKLLVTLGLRSAGSHNGVIFLAGPSFGASGIGVTMFAFKDDAAHTYLGSHTFTDYDNIRKWIVADGVLYTAVGAVDKTVEGINGEYGGRVLRWTGDDSNPFSFEEVGYLPGSGAELAVHENRLFVTTWPASELTDEQPVAAGVYMGPILPEGGLISATVWEEIWNAADYEPDPVIALTYGGGAIASFDGYLYWGTMHVPGVAALAAEQAYSINITNPYDYAQLFLNTNRAISIFRSQSPEAGTEVELLYGEHKLQAYDRTTRKFVATDNKMGEPLWGTSGFGNMFNNYTWTMQVYNHKLYIGTMDWSYLGPRVEPLFADYVEQYGIETDPGADLWRIESSDSTGAVAEDLTGIGNYGSYGIRTILADATSMYLGMANPMNLMTDPNDGRPQGGWELIKMSDPTLQPVPPEVPVTKKGGGSIDLMDLYFLMLLFGLFGFRKLYAKA